MTRMTAKLHSVFVANVRLRMSKIGLNQSDLARKLSVTPSKVSAVLNSQEGYCNPTLELVERYADALGTDAYSLLRPSKLAQSA